MTVNVIASSSKGNAIIYHNEILVDVGVPYNQLDKYLDDIKIILISHSHTDHFKNDVIARIALAYPDITWVVGAFLEPNLKRLGVSSIKVIEPNNEWLQVHDYLLYPVELFHGDRRGRLENYGFRIIKDNHKTIHMTDAGSYDGIIAKDYDLICIEANHNEDLINKAVEEAQREGKFAHGFLSRIYHANTRIAREFVNANANENTTVLFLHPSSTYLSKEELEQIERTWENED